MQRPAFGRVHLANRLVCPCLWTVSTSREPRFEHAAQPGTGGVSPVALDLCRAGPTSGLQTINDTGIVRMLEAPLSLIPALRFPQTTSGKGRRLVQRSLCHAFSPETGWNTADPPPDRFSERRTLSRYYQVTAIAWNPATGPDFQEAVGSFPRDS